MEGEREGGGGRGERVKDYSLVLSRTHSIQFLQFCVKLFLVTL